MQPNAKRVDLTIETIPGGNRFTLQAPPVSFLIKLFLGLLTLVCLFYILSILVRSEVSEGEIIGAIVVALIFLFITRLFLWNTFGREVFEVTDEILRHYNDYQLFQDELVKIKATSNATFSYQSVLDASFDKDTLDDQERNSTNKYYLILLQDGEELSKSHLLLEAVQIKRIFTLD